MFSFTDFTGCFTVTLQVYFLLPALAVIVAVPFFFAVTTPFEETVATLFLEVVHLTFPEIPLSLSVYFFPVFNVSFVWFSPVFVLAAWTSACRNMELKTDMIQNASNTRTICKLL
ncbi:hypothetical protein BRYFOR_05487 [Marvinbryantia formatexigens DSM 14469]|uniref:Uncharacterized protein n=1 Tax=Marvinbryantia formatexigens DSM 14469 TaxID=478749 RepID=C6LA45_9FIRM|nr:hypothetical protein BRYFOR_05487 [Marvinbryantia formatexigens DSM 14469]